MRNNALALTAITGLLAACSLAPDFAPPQMNLPPKYQEQQASELSKLPVSERGRWKKAEELDAASKGEWWRVFADPELNMLQKQAMEANASLSAAANRVEQSRATAEANTFSFLPDLDLNSNAVRSKPSDASLAAFGNRGVKLKPYNLYSARGVLSYEADLFGRVRDSYKAFLLDADRTGADFQNTLLTLQADVASNYFSIRAIDSEIALLKDTVAIREKAHEIMKHKYDAGAAGEQDLTRTMSELASTRAELSSLERERSVLEHALAVLVGKLPSEFTLKKAPLSGVPPQVPAGLPSTLLERRPDIASARSAMEAANARIGVARTAFFPQIILTASGGYEATELSDVFKWSSRAWALGQAGGAAITMPVFDTGRNFARLDSAKASFQEAVDNYRQQVLVAFRDVEDNLANERYLAEQSHQQDAAAAAASRTTEVIQTRYDEGAVEFFEVVNAQRDSLATERAAVKVRGLRFLSSIALIRALGGGWNVPEAANKPVALTETADSEEDQESTEAEKMDEETPTEKPAIAKPEETKKTPEPKATVNKAPAKKAPVKKTSQKKSAAGKKSSTNTKAKKGVSPAPEPVPAPVKIAPQSAYEEPQMPPTSPSPAASRRQPMFSTEINK